MWPLLDLVSVGSARKTKRGKAAAAGNPSSVCSGEELQAWGSREGFLSGGCFINRYAFDYWCGGKPHHPQAETESPNRKSYYTVRITWSN